jgi:hypothetical protein
MAIERASSRALNVKPRANLTIGTSFKPPHALQAISDTDT